MMELAQRLETAFHERFYHPDGVNVGMNVGKAAGAGIAGHIHMHALPRWVAARKFHDRNRRNSRAAGGTHNYLSATQDEVLISSC